MKTTARGCFGFQKKAKSKHSRLCFKGSADYAHFVYDQTRPGELLMESYPNYKITQDGKISLHDPKPNNKLSIGSLNCLVKYSKTIDQTNHNIYFVEKLCSSSH